MRASSAAFLLRLFFEAILLPTADALWVTLKRLTERDTLVNTYMHRNTPIYNTMQCKTIQYNTIQYNTIQYNTIQYNTIQYNTIQYNTIQYNTIQYNTIQYTLDYSLAK